MSQHPDQQFRRQQEFGSMVAELCRNCAFAKVKARGLCGACLAYKNRTGKERPAKVVLRHIGRVLEDEQVARRRLGLD